VQRESIDEPADGIRLGLADLPAEQRQDAAVWRPETDGSMLVLGMARTGKTTLLDTIAAESARLGSIVVERIGQDPERAWDVVHALSARLGPPRAESPLVLVLIDDLDSLLAAIDAEDAVELRDGIFTLLRDGPRSGVHVVIAMQRLAGPTTALGGFVGSTVILGTANRQEHLLAGGDSGSWVEGRRPGSAMWRGVSVQLCAPETTASATPRHAASETVRPIDWTEHPLWLVVSRAPARLADGILAGNAASTARPPVRVAALADAPSDRITVEQVRRHAGNPVVIVGDSEQWQAHWPLLTALRSDAALIVDGCSVAEFRALTRIRDRPPLLARLPDRAWRVSPDGAVSRVSVGSAATG
jgi:S-DNA-T family DNA segregation ATPase FtsK/SpoIIIE